MTEQELIEEGKIRKKETIVALTPPFRDAVINYLKTRPYEEVSLLIKGLESCSPFEITING